MSRLKSLLTLVLLTWAVASSAELQIEVTQGADNAVRIAVVPFNWRGRGELPLDIHEVITADLRLSGRFDTLPVNQMLSLPSRAEDVYSRDWQLLSTEYVVIGEITESGPDLKVRFELIDVFKNEAVFGQ